MLLTPDSPTAHESSVHVVVVGAGTAGSIVAATLSENPSVQVTLIEAGVDRHTELPANLFVSMDDPTSRWPGAYQRGKGVGGSSEINGCVMTMPADEEIDAWADLTGDAYWGWAACASVFAEVDDRSISVEPTRWGRADRALVNAIGSINAMNEDGTGHPPAPPQAATWRPARFAFDPVTHKRSNFGFAQLAEARPRRNLRVETETEVDRILIDSEQRVDGVQLTNGDVLRADHAVVCAGAVGSPTLLRRSGVDRPGIGSNLTNHVGLSFTWRFPSDDAGHQEPESVSCIRAVVGAGTEAVELLPLNLVGTSAELRFYGGVLCCPLGAVASRGTVVFNDAGEPTIDMDTIAADRILLRKAARIGAAVMNLAVSAGDAESALADADGTPVQVVAEMSDGDLDDWIRAHPAPLYHATGTCRMGPADDPLSVVDSFGAVHGLTGLSVIDASSIPALPAAGPHLTVSAFALHASRRLSTRLSSTEVAS